MHANRIKYKKHTKQAKMYTNDYLFQMQYSINQLARKMEDILARAKFTHKISFIFLS